MPITEAPSANTTSGYQLPMLPGMGGQGGGASMPGFSMSLPTINPGVNMGGINPSGQNQSMSAANIYDLLSRSSSMTGNLLPGLQQILGTQTQAMMPMFTQQMNQNIAGAQSDAMSRGLTGSSIEAANMLGARLGGQQNMNQFLGQQLGQLGNAYQSAVGYDVNQQNQMYQTLAQAIGQQLASQQGRDMFQQQLAAAMQQAQMLANAQQQSGMYGAIGAGLGGLLSGAGQAGGFGKLFS